MHSFGCNSSNERGIERFRERERKNERASAIAMLIKRKEWKVNSVYKSITVIIFIYDNSSSFMQN